jgi:DNA repair protein RecO (recombination protein O)
MARPRTYKTHGVVLRYTPLMEADRIVTLYTPDVGKLRAVARGVRRTRSRLGGHLEPLTHVSVSLAEGRGLDTITGVDTIRSFRPIKEDLHLVSKAVYLAELVDSFSVEQSPNEAAFELLISALGGLQTAENPAYLMRYFEARLLLGSGFGPELRQCVECRATLEPGDHVFSCSKGGILCPQCRVLSGDALVSLSLNAVKVLRFFQRQSYARAAKLTLAPALLEELERLLATYIRHVLERVPNSTEFMSLLASGVRDTGAGRPRK